MYRMSRADKPLPPRFRVAQSGTGRKRYSHQFAA